MSQDCISRTELRKRVIESRDKLKAQGNLPLPSGYAACLELIDEAPTLTADDYFDAVDRIKPCPNCRYTLLGALTEDEPQRWIPVTDHMPEEDANVKFLKSENLNFTTVLAYGKSKGVRMTNRLNVQKCGFAWLDKYATDGWEWSKGNDDITHWMPLPEPPKEDENGQRL